jgi:dephospho-CoA kinase
VMQAIVDHFGQSILTGECELDRAKLAQIAFADGRVEELNALVHPAVIAEQARWMNAIRDEDPQAIAVVESALIFETKHGEQSTGPWRTRFDRIVVVTAPEALRKARYIARLSRGGFGVSAEAAAQDFERRAQVQWSDERKAALADTVLRNDGSMEDLREKVKGLYAVLRQEALDRRSEAM